MVQDLLSGGRQYLESIGIAVSSGDDHGVDEGRITRGLAAVDDNQRRSLDMMLHGVINIVLQLGCRFRRSNASFQFLVLSRRMRGYLPNVIHAEVALFLKKG